MKNITNRFKIMLAGAASIAMSVLLAACSMHGN